MKICGKASLNFKPCLHVTSTSSFFVPFKNWFNVDLWGFVHISYNVKKIICAAHKNVTLTVHVNEASKCFWSRSICSN